MTRDIVVGAAHGYSWGSVRSFVASLRLRYFGDVVLFTDSRDDQMSQNLRKHGIEAIDVSVERPYCNSLADYVPLCGSRRELHPADARSLWACALLRSRMKTYDHVFLSDVRDVVFQDDPFSWGIGNAVHAFLESGDRVQFPMRSVAQHMVRLGRLFGESAASTIGHCTCSCSGTVFAGAAGAMDYLERMSYHMQMAKTPQVTDPDDQGAHNWIIYSEEVGVTLHPAVNPIVAMPWSYGFPMSFNSSGFAVDASGTVVKVVHGMVPRGVVTELECL